MTLEKHGPGPTVAPSARPAAHVPPASGDALDRIVRLAPPWTVFALVASALLVVGMVVWAVTGTVSSSVTTPGFLDDVGATTVRASTAGQVDRVPVALGESVAQGQVVVVFRDGTTLTAPLAGQVVAVSVSPGSTVVSGQSVVIVADLAVDPFVVTKLAPSYISTVRVGMPVRMELEGVPATRYGYLLGTLSEISNDPFTNDRIATRLGVEPEVVAAALGDKPGLLAVVRLQPDRSTPTGFAWTVGQGPSIVAQQGLPITVHTVLKESTPLGMVFPQFARP
jgi:multidrug efflux pump subunit AcrA (membrane-fusion protein)